MGPLPVEEQISWSRNAEALLKELQTFGADFASRVENASMRHTSDLIPLVPADTMVLASLPNASEPFKDSYLLFRQRVSENETLASWWQNAVRPAPALSVDELVNRLSEVGAYIGSEVIVAFPKNSDGQLPLLLAEATRPEPLVSALEADLRRLEEAQGAGIRLAHDEAELASMTGTGLVIYINDGLMIASDLTKVRRTIAIRKGTVTNTFSSTPLYARLAEAYNEGVGWLLAVDLQQTLQIDGTNADQTGIGNAQQLVLEQKTGVGTAASQVSLSFGEQRRGLTAWLGSPAPMGALDFVSQDTYGFSSWITKDPASIMDDILSFNSGDASFAQQLQTFQESQNIDIRRDLVEPLGNEALIAIDGPLLPTPSWKVVIEVRDSARLENTLQWVVTRVNRELEASQQPTWNLESETVDGKTYHSLTSAGSPLAVHFTSWMGYMILAPSRALLTDAIRIYDTGTSISRSAKFRAEMPPDGRDIASAVVYQNVEAMAKSLPSGTVDLSQDVRAALNAATLVQQSLPKMVFIYGENNRILGSARGSYGLRIASMFGMQHLLGVAGMDGLH
jgi:hypothetical protein